MGFDGGEPERYEGPEREISIATPFAAGRTEITVDQFRRFVEEANYSPAEGCFAWDGKVAEMREAANWEQPGYGRAMNPDEPVVCVDWTDASAYAAWLAERTGQPYRLLSEAEWEYAANAGSTDRFPWGEDPSLACRYANIFDQDAAAAIPDSPLDAVECSDGAASATNVARYEPNAFGLYDMVGNVWEWTADCYQTPYPSGPLDGSPVTQGECSRRSVKGGSWVTAIERQRPTFRGRDPEDRASLVFGFRVGRDLRTAPPQPAPRD